MKMIKPLLFSLAFLLTAQLYGQDIHWPLFNLSPLTLNAAHTGDFEGTFRVGGIYRDQARSVLNELAYRTPSIHVDAPVLMVGKRNWIGVGAVLYSDEAGAGALENTGALFSAAFHVPTNQKATSVFSFGIQGGFIQRRIDMEKLTFEDGYSVAGNAWVFEPTMSMEPANVDDNINYLDFGAGAMLRSQLNNQTALKLGLAVKHITTPRYNLISGNENRAETEPDSVIVDLPLRVNFHGQFDFNLNKKWVLSPTFLYSTIKSSNNIQLQATLGYLINPEKDITLRFGLGYRLSDAAEFLVGLDYKNFRVGASYDMTLSSLNDLNKYAGGFELGLSYIAVIFKSAEVKPVIFCPRF